MTKTIEELKIWFQKTKYFDVTHLNPGQHFIRRDSPSTLESIYENEGKLIIELNSKRKYIISGDIQYRFINDNLSLEIDHFDLLVLEWIDELESGSWRFDGTTDTRHCSRTYDEGTLLFMSCNAITKNNDKTWS